MEFPYHIPKRIRSNKRCQFSMPGRKYNCRCVGAYELSGKVYCAPHYDMSWKVQNPVIGQQHEWGEKRGVPICLRCGVVKVYDGLPQNPCRGNTPAIVLWNS